MRCDMPDAQFLEFVDLNHPSMQQAAALAAQGRTRRAARAAAAALFADPFRHPIQDAQIPSLAREINRRVPRQVKWLTGMADNYLLAQPRNGLVCGANHEEEVALYRVCVRPWQRRGDAVHALGRLYRLTGQRKYFDGAVQEMRRIVAAMEPLADGELAGAFGWHPHGEFGSHEPGHMAEKICNGLPYLRADLSADDALLFAKALLAMADFNYRTCRYDVTHNITLHMLTGCLLVGLCFPLLRPAGEWVDFIQKRLEGDFASEVFVSADGYYGEGFGYQHVNHNLMQVCLRYLQAAGRKVAPRLRRVCEKSFEFAAAITRPDGNAPLFGDCHSQMAHEHYIQSHEMLHYAAAFFRRPDLKAAAGSPYCQDPLEYNIWLMGEEGLAWWDSVPMPLRKGRRVESYDFRASGLQLLGLGQGVAGHSGMLACARTHNHAHCDFGSIDLYGLGRPLLTDTSVTSYAEDSYRSERAHNAVVPVRRHPLGPRLDRLDHARTLFVVRTPKIQAACMEHDLYETHRIRRTVCLVDAGATLGTKGKGRGGLQAGDVPAFWLVIDRVERSCPHPGATEPQDFLETYFHFNAPQTQLGCDAASLTAWSRFDPDGVVLRRYAPTDVQFRGKSQRVPLEDYLRAYEDVTSDANLQVSAVLPPQHVGYIMDMRLFEGFTGEYHGRVKRPSLAYRWRGFLPFEAAYVLVPFRGVREKPYAAVTGNWAGQGDLSVTVQLPQGGVRVTARGLAASRPSARFAVSAAR